MMLETEEYFNYCANKSYKELCQEQKRLMERIKFSNSEENYVDPDPLAQKQMYMEYLKIVQHLIWNFIFPQIQDCVEKIWTNKIFHDYRNDWLLREDCLKNAFYHYLRAEIGNFLENHDIRIFTEYILPGTDYRPDLTFVQLSPAIDRKEKHLEHCVIEPLIIMEFKYTDHRGDKNILSDIIKMSKYIKHGCAKYYYMASIFETETVNSMFWSDETVVDLGKGQYTEMAASYWNGNLRFAVKNY